MKKREKIYDKKYVKIIYKNIIIIKEERGVARRVLLL
jgi:hypothetical protein